MSEAKQGKDREGEQLETPEEPESSGTAPAALDARPAEEADETAPESDVEDGARAGEQPAGALRERSSTGKRKPRARGQVAAPASTASRLAPVVIVALAIGAAGGWFGHIAQAKARVRAETAAAASASGAVTGPCGAWREKICESGGAKSAVCQQAQGAVELLPSSSCEDALSVMPATLAKMKAARATCDTLAAKLCRDLPPGSRGCEIVKEQTPAFPTKRCDDLNEHYSEVLAELQRMDTNGGPGGPPGAAPH